MAKIISLHAESAPVNPAAQADSLWCPDMNISLNDFLEAELDECLAKDIMLVEWKASRLMYGKKYLFLIETCVEIIKKNDANIRTTLAFGHIWLKNFIKNLDLVSNIIQYEVFSNDILVTGAGPSLDSSISLIKEHREKLFLVASSSSIAALHANDIKADIIISTDGGNWARLHLYEVFRDIARSDKARSDKARSDSVLCTALSGVLPAQCKDIPLLLLSDTSSWQNYILKKLRLPYLSLPQRGTVTASALDLAFALSRGNIFVAGMDLQNNDIISHAKPYSFNYLLEEKERRINPFYSQSFKRASLIKEGASYKIYEEWFKRQISIYPRSVYSLGSNNPLFNKSRVIETGNINEVHYKLHRRSQNDSLKEKALLSLKSALDLSQIKIELSALLFPGLNVEKISRQDLLKAIKEAGF